MEDENKIIKLVNIPVSGNTDFFVTLSENTRLKS